MPLQLLKHPLSVHTLLLRVMQDVDLPKSQQELTYDRVTHRSSLYSDRLRRRFGFSRAHVSPGSQLVGAASCDFIARPQIAEHFHQRS
jgi:hypothetical protein